MRCFSVFVMLTVCVALAASGTSAQPPKDKKGDGPKGGKGGLTGEALVEDIVNRMMAFDKNKDGKLTRDEITDSRLLRLFDKADADKDGVVTRDELLAVARQMVAEMGAEGGKGGKGGPGGPGGPGGKGGDKGGKGGPGGKGGFGGGAQPGQILSPFAQEALNLTADQKKQVESLQKEVDERLAKILTDAQQAQLKEMQESGFGGPKGPPGGKKKG